MKILNYSVKKCIIFLIFIIIGYFIEKLLSNKYNYFSVDDKESNDTCNKSCYGLTYNDISHEGNDVCKTNECSKINKYTSLKNFGCSKDETLFLKLGECCNTQKCDSPLCPNNLLYHDGSCYSLLDENDNLSNLFFGQYILCEINHVDENRSSIKKDYSEFTETGSLEEIYSFLTNPNIDNNNTKNIILSTIGIIIVYLIGIMGEPNNKSFPLPKVLFNRSNNFSIFGYTFINNGNESIILDKTILYKGGGLISYSDTDKKFINIVFYEDFAFENINYQDATFENNTEGYKGYILDESKFEDYKKDNFKKNYADVIIKFYKKTIKSVPTGIEPVT